MSAFSEILKELILEHNNFQHKEAKIFAKEIGVNATTITRYLNGERMPSVENLIKIANYFNCSSDFLLGRTEENTTGNFKACPVFSEQFIKLLKHFNCNCLTFSVKTEIHQSRVYDWKNGKRKPTLDNIIKIADNFDCSVDYVIGRQD